jgi:predicted RNase H-like HicB family nuclease
MDPQELMRFVTECVETSGPFSAVYEHTDDGWWVVSVPEIPGAHSQGRTLDEAREMIRDAVRMLLEVRREDAERETAGREVIREPLAL